MTAEQIIKLLDLKKLPEGGWFGFTWRNVSRGKLTGTSIYLLITEESYTPWHRTQVSQVWHHYLGAPLNLRMAADANGPAIDYTLGTDLANDQLPQQIVPEGWWRMAKPMGEFALVGCNSSPGFDRDRFELADPQFDIS